MASEGPVLDFLSPDAALGGSASGLDVGRVAVARVDEDASVGVEGGTALGTGASAGATEETRGVLVVEASGAAVPVAAAATVVLPADGSIAGAAAPDAGEPAGESRDA